MMEIDAGHLGARDRAFAVSTTLSGSILRLVAGVVPEEFRADSNIAVDPTGVVLWGTANGLRRRDADAGVRIANGRLQYAVAGPSGGAGVNTGIGSSRWWLGPIRR